MRYYEWILDQLRKDKAMTDLDWGAIHKCAQCGKQQPEPRCVEYNDRMYCGLTCKRKQERKDDAALCNPRPRVVYIER